MRIEQVEQLMHEVGPVLDPLELTYFPGEKVWGLRFDEASSVIVDFLDDVGKLYLTSELGKPPAESRYRLYELMLAYNFHWHATGGGRLSLDGPDGQVVLVADIAVAGLDRTQLAKTLRVFADVASVWRQIVREPTKTDPSLPLVMDEGMVLV